MSNFEIIINCITALGALATAGTFIYVIRSQKGTQKQIDSLSQMAATFTRQYEMARIQAGNTIYPKIKITLKHDVMWGMKILVKNLSYPIEIYRMQVCRRSRRRPPPHLHPAPTMMQGLGCGHGLPVCSPCRRIGLCAGRCFHVVSYRCPYR